MIGDATWVGPTPLPWMDDAACADVDPDIFFAENGKKYSDAKAVCDGCPVVQQCLEFAVSNGVRVGVWGGLTPEERKGVSQGRPRRKPGTRVDYGLVALYVAEGLSDGAVAERVGCTAWTVLRWRKARGIASNSRGGRGRRS